MIALYVVRPGDDNDELRYSLRSLHANIKHSEVWIVGHRPPWVSDRVNFIPVPPCDDQFLNQRQKLRVALDHMPKTFAVWNDDYYALKPSAIRLQHQGRLAEHAARFAAIRPRAIYTKRLQHSLEVLGPDAMSYEIHRPMPVRRDALADTLDACDRDPWLQWLNHYGNTAERGRGQRVTDNLGWWPEADWCSTDDFTFRGVEVHLAERFPTPSPYEQ